MRAVQVAAVEVIAQLAVTVMAILLIVSGIRGLLGRDLYLPTRGGYTGITGRAARIVGGVVFVAGLWMLMVMHGWWRWH